MDDDPTFAFFAVARLCGIDWYALCSHNGFPYEFKTGKQSFDSSLDSIVYSLADSTMENVNETESILSIFRIEAQHSTCRFSLP